MESAKRASVVIIVWNLNFSFFFEKRGSKGKEVKKQSKKALEENAPTNQKQQKVQFRKKSRIFRMIFFFIHTE